MFYAVKVFIKAIVNCICFPLVFVNRLRLCVYRHVSVVSFQI